MARPIDTDVFVAVLADQVEVLRDRIPHASTVMQLAAVRQLAHTVDSLRDALILNALGGRE